jgi:FtsP/CotA-like multicopper oxidase with cupredoxin domain
MRTKKPTREKERQTATRNRRELIKARLSRRALMKLGLLTSGGYLILKNGLSARASGGDPQSPPTRSFIEPLPIMPVKQPVGGLTPNPTVAPNTAAGEGRTRNHQVLTRFPPRKLYEVHRRAELVSMSPDLPLQTIWGFDGITPGPTYIARYGEPILVRNFNDLPADNGGFGLNEVSTHQHNGHTPSESDGFPCDFFGPGRFYDQHYPNMLAGFDSTHPPNGDPNEALSTLWYHDHRADFTSQNVYKGLAGTYLLFNDKDTGDETTGFRLPSGKFDVPLFISDKVFDENGQLFFDLFNLDGILGDKFLVNGKIQPFFEVHPRRYRFRLLDGGPSRFYQFFLTDLNSPDTPLPFWQISNDGNLLPKPIQVTSVSLSVAERTDIIIDFSQFAGRSIVLENRLEQTDGRGPSGNLLPAGRGDRVLRFDAVLPPVADNSLHPAAITKFYDLPPLETPRVVRRFRFERNNGQWSINGKFFDCNDVRFRVQKNSAEHWVLQNNSGGWQHPIHVHFEEFQILSRNGRPPQAAERSRKDVVRLGFNEEITVFSRFRDFVGPYPQHCHNTVHEDHAMMLRWDIEEIGDRKTEP